jgi:hypothetical protein
MPTTSKSKTTAASRKTAKKSSIKTARTTIKSAKPPKRTASAPSASPKAASNGFHPGTYVVPRGHVSIAVPTFWTLRQTNDDIQVESEASETTVVVTAYHRNEGVQSLDARDYLKHFLETAQVAGPLQTEDGNKQHASARFRDEEGDNWFVRFISNGETLLLATCHSNRPLTTREGKTGVAVLDSIRLKARG